MLCDALMQFLMPSPTIIMILFPWLHFLFYFIFKVLYVEERLCVLVWVKFFRIGVTWSSFLIF